MSADAPPPWRHHGGLREDDRTRAAVQGRPVLDFSVNVNPYGPTPAMVQAIRAADIERYPDDSARAARSALAGLWAVPPDEIVLGNGAAELLWSLARLLVPPGRCALTVAPTFSEFSAAVAAQPDARLVEWRAREDDAFRIDAAAIAARIAETRADAVYLCTPNNPTGAHLPGGELLALARRCGDTTFVVDQAFLSLSEHADELLQRRTPNIVWVRSLTKDHAVPGVRLGAAVMAPALAARIEAARPSWSTSAAAQAAAVAAADETAFLADSRRRLLDDRRAMMDGLSALPCTTVPSATIFVLVRVGDAAALTHTLLARHQILVRDGSSFGLPHHIRLAARPAAERAALLRALAAELR